MPSISIVTGSTSGFGRAVAQRLAGEGHDLVLVARSRSRADDLLAELSASFGDRSSRQVVLADLGSHESRRQLIGEVLALEGPIGLLVNNAGAMFGLRRRQSVDGIELTMALNHFGYFHVTLGLLDPLLEGGGARVVNVASDAYSFARGRFDFDDWQATRSYRPHRQYGLSKLANILFTHELDRRYRAQGIDTVAWAPKGLTATRFAYGANRLAPLVMKLTHPFAASTEDAVQPLLDLFHGDLGDRRGGFVHDDALRPVEVCTDADAERLWELSARIIDSA